MNVKYEVEGLGGIYCVYLCNAIPSADYKRDGDKMLVTVPTEDDDELVAYMTECGYEFRRVYG
jgi:hypothetical protein